VASTRDLLDARPGASGSDPPSAIATRGWASFLFSLTDDELAGLEIHGTDAHWPQRTPPGLRSMVEETRGACAMPAFPAASAPHRSARKGETPRKRAQVEAFGRLVAPLAARATRVLDVGSGHGHLTREVAARVERPVVGLERDATLARSARALSPGASPTFAVTDVLRDGLELAGGECLVGLHACGELGDRMVASAAQARAASLVLVGCCLQKRRQPSRRPLCAAAGLDDLLDLPTRLLGLSNLAARDEGVEATRTENLRARERRLALNRLLADEGGPLRLGAEIEGLNRRAAQRDLPDLVARAFAVRGQPAPSRAAIDQAAAWAREHHARARRLSVPRALLARALEVYVLLDRATYLEAHGFAVQVGTLFPASVSPRNLALVAC
jgi:hypothetical protein